jgi:hypothetical protein
MRGFHHQNSATGSRRYVPIVDDGLVALVMNTEEPFVGGRYLNYCG